MNCQHLKSSVDCGTHNVLPLQCAYQVGCLVKHGDDSVFVEFTISSQYQVC
jgi:hypothetical protein